MTGRLGYLALAVVVLLGGCADRERSSLADGRLTATPGGVDFQKVAIFDAREAEVTLRNVGRARINVNEVWVEGPEGAYLADFTQSGAQDLQPGSASTLKVRFAPPKPGALPAMLVVRSDTRIEPLLRIPLSGMGVAAWAEVSPRRLDFGRIEADASKTLSVTLENGSEMAVEVTPRMVGADRDEFVVAPVTLAAGERKDILVTFNPVRVGRKQVALAVAPCRGCADVPVQVAAEALERAVVAEPEVVDFGAVPVDREAHRESRIRNISTEPVTVTRLTLEGKDVSFSQNNPGFPLVLQPGEVRGFQLRYSPDHQGPAQDTAVYHVESRRHPTLPVGLRGYGGAAELCVSPLSYDFGNQPLGSKTRVIVNVKNCGSSNAGELTLQTLAWQPVDGAPQFNHTPLAMPHVLRPGQEVNIEVFYEPTSTGSASGALVMTTNAFSAATVQMDFRGRAEAHAPCNLTVTPLALDFGTVPPQQGAVLGVKLENKGTDLCPVKNIQLRDNGGGVFGMPGGALYGGIMYPGDWFSFQVSFTSPPAGGSFTGMLQVEQMDPANPVILVPLRANSQAACLVASRRYVDWGVARRDCPPEPQEVNFLNACTAPVTVDNIWIGPGTTDSEFAIDHTPNPMPFTVQPNQGFTVGVDYFAQVYGMNLSPLYVGSSDLPEPLMVPLIGESSKRVEKTDTFVQQDVSKVDVLFVVDNTDSMTAEHPRLVEAVPTFVDTAREKNVNLHVAVTTTGIQPSPQSDPANDCPGGALGGEAGRFFPADNTFNRILTSAMPDLAEQLQRNVQVGKCAEVEEGFEAMRRALSRPLVNNADDPRTRLPRDGNAGFLRDEAALVVLFVSDEDDHSPDAVETYVQWAQELKGVNQPQRATFYAIAPPANGCDTAGGAGTRYAEATARTGGEVVTVCAPDYRPLLRAVADKAFSAQTRFPLSEEPTPGTIVVEVNGSPVTTGWSYDGASNSVVFANVPGPGARISITYRRSCASL
ncbi:choice-of-anchor D domain-containing protein [Pyxidicoccus fallax]|uniref:Choice-of-anchor D domain-containing protein n=1 Tax=Pyxidicoccus fallax TaxID=394095 RepID=A0A848LFQ0_9BACT|nr:choice-of-anchor D domain-containing protein [Pyxidicoccus fallax]NMO17202.1 choice-of-anchor D domain-containing protein [Pyxidicoccus fallax]NPC84469.1 choice-of-anchor D domain-containing protein [Pyxidicoccus fallax]